MREFPERVAPFIAVALSVAALALVFSLVHANSSFDPVLHPDEVGKVKQLVGREFEYFHPQLMLRAAEVINLITTGSLDGGGDWQRVAENGRLASAIMSTAAVALLAWLAWRRHGPTAAILSGLLIATHPNMVTSAHYLKEDAALLFAFAAWLVAADIYLKRRTWRRMSAFAVACGLIASSKFVGIGWAVAGLVLITVYPPKLEEPTPTRRRRHLFVTLVAGVGVALAVWGTLNWPALGEFRLLLGGIDYERRHLLTGHSDGLQYHAWGFIASFLLQWPNVALVALSLIATIGLAIQRHRRRDVSRWLVPASIAIYLLIASAASFFQPRYLLPAEAGLAFLAGVGAVVIGIAITRRMNPGSARAVLRVSIAVGLAAMPIAAQVRRDVILLNAFASDSRLVAWQWLAEHAPPGSCVAAGPYTRANLERDDLTVIDWPMDVPVSALVADGATYAVVSDLWYARFDSPHTSPRSGFDEMVAASRRQTSDLQDGPHELVWSFDNPEPFPRYTYASPSLRIYKLAVSD